MDALQVVLRIVHIGAGITWVGSAMSYGRTDVAAPRPLMRTA
jgi:hypothetical protein